MAKREAQLVEWEGDYRTIQEIADRHNVEYPIAYGWVKSGHKSIETIRGGGKIKRPRPSKPVITAARVKTPAPVHIPKVNENCIVRIRHIQLNDMLNYLAKVTHTTYQAAFEEFCIYIYEGRLWSKSADKDAIAALRDRLNKNRGNGYSVEPDEFDMEEKPKGRGEIALLAIIDELEAENRELKFENAQIKKNIRKFVDALGE